MKYYLAYGSNLNKRQMAYRCPGAEPIGAAVIRDYELVFRRSYLTIEPKKGEVVPVGIWRISDANEAALDRYEGYPRFYRKQYFDIPFWIPGDDGQNERCLAYVMQDGHPIEPPTDIYLTTCRIGYKDFSLDLAPLMAAYERAKWPEDHTTVYTTKAEQK